MLGEVLAGERAFCARFVMEAKDFAVPKQKTPGIVKPGEAVITILSFECVGDSFVSEHADFQRICPRI